MADPLSISASVIGVVTLAYQSCKSLKDIIDSIANAPKTLRDLRRDLGSLQNSIQSLQSAVDGVRNADLSADQQACLTELKPAMQSCEAACDDFVQKLSKTTSHSDESHVNWFDRVRLHFNEKDILLLKSRLGDCKQTLGIAVTVVTLKTVKQNQQFLQQNQGALQELETNIATALGGFTGKLQGLELAVNSLSQTGVGLSEKDVAVAMGLLNEHDRLLKQYVKVCAAGLSETSNVTGTKVKYARAFDEARQWVGNVGDVGDGGPPLEVEYGEARDKSRQGIGSISAEAARDFFR